MDDLRKYHKRPINLIVVHCSATRETQDYTFEQLQRDHKLRGFSRCGYHYYIRRDGTIHIGRPLDLMGAHVQGYNKHSAGICYEGGLDEHGKPKDTRTAAQKQAILKLICEVMDYNAEVKVKRICGHRDLSPDLNDNGIVEPMEWIKQCPCYDAEPEYKHLLT